jgi:hypothetical protein
MEKHTGNNALDRALTALYRCDDIPEGCRTGWREAVRREERQTMQKTRKRSPFLRIALPVAAALVLVIGALSAGSLIPTVVTDNLSPVPAPTALYDYDEGAAYDTAVFGAYEAAAPAGGTNAKSATYAASSRSTTAEADSQDESDGTEATSGQKIVRTADLTIASSDFDNDIQALTDLTGSLGGYVASVNVYGEASERMDRVAYYDLRIPSDQLDAFLSGLDAIGRITSRSESATDMTTQYSDTQMRLTTQQDKMQRLRELFVKAADVSDLLEIESEIADTQYQIDRLENSLRTIDRNVDNSEVTVTVREESAGESAQAVELTLWQRLHSGFRASVTGIGQFLQNLLVFLAMALPVLVPLAVIALIVWLVVRARRRARRSDAKTPGREDRPL